MRWNVLIPTMVLLALSACQSPSRTLGKSFVMTPEILADRKALTIPRDLWDEVREKTFHENNKVGLTAEEMKIYSQCSHTLNNVERLFRDVTLIPKFTGAIALRLTESTDVANSVRTAFRMLEARTYNSGKQAKAKKKEAEEKKPFTWGVKWLDDKEDEDQTIDRFIKYCGDKEQPDKTAQQWKALPAPIKRFSLRLAVALAVAKEHMNEVYDRTFLEKSFFMKEGGVTAENLHRLAVSPWGGEEITRDSFEAFNRIDLNFLSFAVTQYLDRYEEALIELRNVVDLPEMKAFVGKDVVVRTTAGTILITYREGETSFGDEHYAIIIELGGNTRYAGLKRNSDPMNSPFSVHVDLGGNDRYEGAFAFGCYDVSTLFDLQGDDVYEGEDEGMGCGFFGVGLLVDYTGNDKYLHKGLYAQGAGLAGVGMLMDFDGDDEYSCGAYGQGYAQTLGVGFLVDRRGNDRYRAADSEPKAYSSAWGRAVSCSQGSAFGRRADFDDGHSLGGGIAGLIDGAGDDSYYGGVFSQGSGYWLGLGFIEDLGGNDTYRALAYSQGSGVHFGLGSLVDLSGNDRYNSLEMEKGLPFAKQLGSNRDGSLGVFFDGSGDDEYVVGGLMCGFSDIIGVGLFWDRMGDDNYIIHTLLPNVTTPSIGAAFPYEKEDLNKEPRDDFLTTGIFLDTGGKDLYDGTKFVDGHKEGGNLKAVNDGEWYHDRRSGFTGFGIDRDLFK